MNRVLRQWATPGIQSLAVVGCLMFGTAASLAAPLPPPSAAKAPVDDPAKVAAAREFIILYHPRMDPAKTKEMLDHGMANAIAHAKQQNPKLDEKKFEADTRARIMGNITKALDLQARIISRHFTLQELKDLSAFFKSPLGQKLTAETPKIVRDMMQQKRQNGASAQGGPVQFKMLPPGTQPPGASPKSPAQKLH
jgi:uncharacterized protein